MQPSELKQCVIIVNAASTHAKRARKFTKQLQQNFPNDKTTIIKVGKHDYENPKDLIRNLNSLLDRHTLVGIAGGDGSNSYMINLLLTNPRVSAKASKATIVPLWGGNANDLGYMANGLPLLKNMKTILSEGTIAQIQPLQITIQSGRKQTTQLAACYASFGASAFVAHKLNQPRHRNKRVYHLPGTRTAFEASSVTKALLDTKPFQCEIDGLTQPLYDLMLINGSRIAKVDRAPITLTDPYFYEIRSKTNRRRPVILTYAASLFRGVTQRRPPIARRTLVVHDETWLQMDGEVQKVAAGSEVTVQLFAKPIRLLSTKLSNEAAS